MAKKLSKVDNVNPNTLRLKDPRSKFITANDVIREQHLLNLGLTMEVSKSIKGKTGKVMSSKQNPSILKDILDNSRQSCPVCSIELMSPYPMEWIESASIFRCVRCTIEINPFAVEEEPIPEEPTNFGLSAIHDINTSATTAAGNMAIRDRFPIVSSRRKTQGRFEDLEKRKQDNSIDRRLKRKVG